MRVLIPLGAALVAVLIAVSCRGGYPQRICCPARDVAPGGLVVEAPRPPPPAGMPDREIGLDKHLITDLPAARPFTYDDTVPSGAHALERAWHGMPPTVPHDMRDLLPITQEDNACLGCHDPTNPDREADDGKPIPKSHFVDYRAEPMAQRAHVVGARWNCILCHRQRTDARPLVKNTYRR